MQRKAAATAEKDGSITSAATLIDGTPLTPQQLGNFLKNILMIYIYYFWYMIIKNIFLGLMGMEALETVVGYWEDALAAYQPRNGINHVLTTG